MGTQIKDDGVEACGEIAVFVRAATEDSSGENAEAERGDFEDEGEKKKDDGGNMAFQESFDCFPDFAFKEKQGKDAENGDEADEHGKEERERVSVPVDGGFDGQGTVEVGFVSYKSVFKVDERASEDVGDETDDGANGERLKSVVDDDADDGREVGGQARG